uniref:DUF6538 domain-containing protein n=1 Tax=Roseovarius indicus TaxID=540747 RepID=UPI003B5253B0
MPGHTRLYRRGATYYHRAAIPKDIADTYPKAEETFSLKTKDRAEALRRVRVEAVRVDERFEAHRRWLASQNAPAVDHLPEERLATIKQAYLHHLLDEDEEARLDGFEEPDAISAGEELQEYTPRPSFEEYEELVEDMDSATRRDLARGKQDEFFLGEAEEVLDWEGIETRLAASSPDWKKVVKVLQEASVEAHEAKRRRNRGDVVPTPPAPLQQPVNGSATTSAPTVSDAFERWAEQKALGNSWTAKAKNDYRNWLSLFIEVCGDRPITDYRKADGREFKDVLTKLPTNWRKMPETRNGDLRSAMERGQKSGMNIISIATINKGLGRMNAFWEWASSEYDDVPVNVLAGLKLDDTTSARNKRQPFSPEQLQALFNSPVYTGCLSEKLRSVPGETDMRHTHWHWLPLLGLFTGARLNELCQLYVGDVREESGIGFLRLTNEGEGQRIKGRGHDIRSRDVPLHRELVRLGFLEFVEDQKDAGQIRLFSQLKADASGYFSGKMSEAFSTYLKQIGVKTAKTSFHSFRHTFKDSCRASGVEPHLSNALLGHAEEGTGSVYGTGGYGLPLLRDAVDKVDYQSLSLEYVKPYSG